MLLHCGDAYTAVRWADCPPALRVFQRVMADDNAARVRNRERLRELAQVHGDEVRLFCAHDPIELERERSAT